MEDLSSRQREIFDFIKTYFDVKGFCPAVADIAKGLGLHDGTVAVHINILKEKGYVQSDYRIARSLRAADPEETGE
jgi:repressor LexA